MDHYLYQNLSRISHFHLDAIIKEKVLQEMCNAFNSGYKYIVLEAPTGFGKSPVAIAVARTLGSSYICTSTKDLQTQYSNDFSIVIHGNNFI
jgi:superfamily II DNA or RNA helicase